MNIKKVREVHNLWRIASRISNRNVRIFFCVVENEMVLLHSFIKRENQNYQNEIGGSNLKNEGNQNVK